MYLSEMQPEKEVSSMKNLKFVSLMFTIWAAAVYVRFAPIKEVFQEKPIYSFVIFLVASAIYRMTMED